MFKINWKPALLFATLSMATLVALLVEVILQQPQVLLFQIFTLFSVFGIIATVLWATMHYQCWKAIPEKYRRTSPGRAVGLMFVPFYHVYWYFVSYPGLSRGLKVWNKDTAGTKMHTGYKFGLCIATIGTLYFVKSIVNLFVPSMTLHLNFYIGAGLLAAVFVLMIGYYKNVIGAINRLQKNTAHSAVALDNA